MRVLIFHQYFATSQDAGAGTRTYELGRRLVRHGDSVTIITGNTIYFSGKRASDANALWSRTNVEGIDVVRINIPFGASHSVLPRIVGFLWFIPFALLVGLFSEKPDVVVATSTPLTIGIPGYLLSRLQRAPFVLELRDLWPDCIVAWEVVNNKALIKAGYWLEAFLYHHADKLLTVTDGIRNELVKNKGIDSARISVITNASDIELFTPNGPKADLQRLAGIPKDSFVCVHAGTLGFANCLDLLLAVAERLGHIPSVHFLILGTGPHKPRLMAIAAQRGLTSVHFLDAVPKLDVPSFLRSAQLGITTFRPSPLTYIFLPNKFFDYLACGLPVLVNFQGEAQRYLEDAGAGVCVPSDDAESCSKVIEEMAAARETVSEMSRNARKLSETCFSWDLKASEFRNLISSIRTKHAQALPSLVQT
jgi:glycosyltransferase involved in cell wall biosynthesis